MATGDMTHWQWWVAPPGMAQDPSISQMELRKQSTFCTASQSGLATSLQVMLHLGLVPPWTSWDGVHRTRVAVTGILNPETLAAVYAYLAKFVDSTTASSFKQHMTPKRQWKPSDLALLAWLAYYAKTYEVADDGTVTVNPPRVAEADYADLIVTANPYVDDNKMRVDAATRLDQWNSWPMCMTYEEFLRGDQPQQTIAAKSKSAPSVIIEDIQKLPPDQVLSNKPIGSPRSSGSSLPLIVGLAIAGYFLLRKD